MELDEGDSGFWKFISESAVPVVCIYLSWDFLDKAKVDSLINRMSFIKGPHVTQPYTDQTEKDSFGLPLEVIVLLILMLSLSGSTLVRIFLQFCNDLER